MIEWTTYFLSSPQKRGCFISLVFIAILDSLWVEPGTAQALKNAYIYIYVDTIEVGLER